jgi:hypothetical protein
VSSVGRQVESTICHSECPWACGPPMGINVPVILSEAKDLQFSVEATECRFFASLRMTDFWESEAKNLGSCLIQNQRDSSLRSE